MFWKKNKDQKKILESPRGGHYIFAHQAIRQICQPDPEQFFGYMASDEQLAYLQFMLDQVANLNSEEAPDFSAEEIEVTLSRIGHYPLLVFSMPQPKAYTECVYVALVSLLDGNHPEATPQPEVACFTLELGEAENGDVTRFFCQWQDDDHLNIAEMDKNCSLADFALAIKQRISAEG